MKKVVLLIGIIFSNYLFSQSQKSGAVVYHFKHLSVTLSKTYYEEDMVLYFNQDVSSYKSYTAVIQDSIIQAEINKKFQNGGVMQLGSMKKTTKQNIYRDLNKRIIHMESKFPNDIFIYEDTLVEIKWELLNKEKNIGGLICRAAKTKYYGRNYIVWYALDIPLSFGPWKLYGLPGLILEAIDEKQQVQFTFNGLLFKNIPQMEFSPSKLAILTTKSKFSKILESYRQNPSIATNGLPISLTVKPNQNKQNVFNNAIELQ